MAGFQMDHYHMHTYVPGQEIEKPKTKWIWKVFWILLAVTFVEVSFAFINDLGMGQKRILPPVGEKWLFIALTLVKAFYIVFSFMHLGDEKKSFKITIMSTTVFLIYFIALMMFEGYALRDIQTIRPDFFKRVYHGESHAGESHDAAAGHGEHGSEHKDAATDHKEAHH